MKKFFFTKDLSEKNKKIDIKVLEMCYTPIISKIQIKDCDIVIQCKETRLIDAALGLLKLKTSLNNDLNK